LEAAARKSTPTVLSQFWLLPGSVSGSVVVGRSITAINILAQYTDESLAKPHVESVDFIEEGSTLRHFGLYGVEIVGHGVNSASACLTIKSRVNSTFHLNNGGIFCSLEVQNLLNSTTLRVSNHSVIGVLESSDHINIAIKNGHVVLEDAIVALNISIYVQGIGMFNVSRASISRSVWVEISASTSVFFQDTSTTDPIVFLTSASRNNPYRGVLQKQFYLSSNQFNGSVSLVGSTVVAILVDNIFHGNLNRFEVDNDERTSRDVPHYSPNLILGASCTVDALITRNRFTSGTFYMDYPDSSNKTRPCIGTLNPYTVGLKIKGNIFDGPPEPIKITPSFLLSRPLAPAVSVTTSLDTSLPETVFPDLIIDLKHNWWGASTGPWFCANNAIGGAWTSKFIDNSQWCLDINCTSFSNVNFDQWEIIRGCPMWLNTNEIIVVICFSVIALLIIIVSIIYLIYQDKKKFSQKHFINLMREDLLADLTPIFTFALVASSLVAACSMIDCYIVLSRNAATHVAPQQRRLQYIAVIIFWIFFAMAAAQILLNLLAILFIRLRRKRPDFLQFYASKFYACTVLVLCATAVLSFIWIPADSLNTKAIQGGDYKNVTITATMTWFVYFPIMLTIAFAVITLIPVHTLNQLLYHYEYAKINSALETALLKDLASSPDVNKRALRVRVLAIVSALACLVTLGFTISTIKSPELFYKPSMRFLSPTATFRARSTIGLTFVITAFVSNLLAVWVTFSYNRVALLTALVIAMIASCLGEALDSVLWISFLNSPMANILWCYLNMGSSGVYVLTSAVTIILTYQLRSTVLEELPLRSISNLNLHLDRVWGSAPDHVISQYLSLTSDDEGADQYMSRSLNRDDDDDSSN
jgi:hypothetical protein